MAVARLWPALAFVVFLGALFGLWRAFPDNSAPHVVAVTLWTLTPPAWFLVHLAYTKLDPYRLWVDRMWFTLSNPSSTWGIKAELDVDDSQRAKRDAEQMVRSRLSGTDAFLAGDSDSAAWVVGGVAVQITADAFYDPTTGEKTGVLRLTVPPVTQPFRNWRPVIAEHVAPLFSAVETKVRPTGQKYTVVVTFPRNNPYFGLFVAGVERSSIARFDIQYFERKGPDRESVRLRADRLEIVTGDLLSAQDLSLRYLALSASPPRA